MIRLAALLAACFVTAAILTGIIAVKNGQPLPDLPRFGRAY